MTYKIVKSVHVDCVDHGFDWEEDVRKGFKFAWLADLYLRIVFNSRKYKNGLRKLYEDRHANKIEETYVILDDDDNLVNKYYYVRRIYKDE